VFCKLVGDTVVQKLTWFGGCKLQQVVSPCGFTLSWNISPLWKSLRMTWKDPLR